MGKRTPLFEIHKAMNAKLVEFAGFEMPLNYAGIIPEHLAVRNSVGIFDVSHMGEFEVRGSKALEQMQWVTTNDVSALGIYQVQYSMLCNEKGGIVDDILVYRLPDNYLIVVNASNIEKDFGWIKNHPVNGAQVENRSDNYALISVQGPQSREILLSLTSADFSTVPYYHVMELELAGIPILLSRTGYTGEVGYELFVSPEKAARIWEAVMDAGQKFSIQPAGLGARDSLRLEKCYRLYGNDIDDSTSPLEGGLGHWVKLGKGPFIGREAIQRVKEQGISRKLVGFVMEDRAIARHGYSILKNGKIIGTVTSGIFSPVLKKGIGLGYVTPNFSEIGTTLEIDIRGKNAQSTIIKTPFI